MGKKMDGGDNPGSVPAEWVLKSEHQGDIAIDNALLIGRDENCDICIPDNRVSREHARLSLTPSGPRVADLGSSNGTFVNDQRISEPTLLKSGDLLQLHSMEFRVEQLAEKEAERSLLKSDFMADVLIRGAMIVGREDSCDITIDDKNISRKHAIIKQTSAGTTIEDTHSINGTFVNESRISQVTTLKNGDQIRFCDKAFTFCMALDPDATRIAAPIFDPDATRVVAPELDPNATMCSEAIVKRPEKQGAVPKSSPPASQKVEQIIQSQPETFTNTNPDSTSARRKLSAVQRQLIERKGVTGLLSQLTVGSWVEIVGREDGKSKVYKLASIDGPGNRTYSFVKTTGLSLLVKKRFELLKKDREEVNRLLATGQIRLMSKAPFLEKLRAPSGNI